MKTNVKVNINHNCYKQIKFTIANVKKECTGLGLVKETKEHDRNYHNNHIN